MEDVFAGWSPEVEIQAKKNMELGMKIKECHEECERLVIRLRELKADLQRQTELFRLMVDARKTWPQMQGDRRWTKHAVMAALIGTEPPEPLTEKWLYRCYCQGRPQHGILADRDVLLTRLARSEFVEVWGTEDGDETLFEPEELWWSDKEVMSALFAILPSLMGRDEAPFRLLDDEDIFRAVLQGPCSSNTKYEGLRFCSKRLLSNETLMVECVEKLGCPLTSRLWESPLNNSKRFALQVAGTIKTLPDGILRRFSHQLRADKDVVLAFSRKGVCLGDASSPLRRDGEVTRQASRYFPMAITKSIASRTMGSPTGKKDFMLEVIGSAKNHHDASKIFKKCSRELQKDKDIIQTAARHGVICTAMIKTCCAGHDMAFWEAVIANRPCGYLDFLEANRGKHNRSLAAIALRSISKCTNSTEIGLELVVSLYQILPEMFQDRETLLQMAENFVQPHVVLESVIDKQLLYTDKDLVVVLARAEPEDTLRNLLLLQSELRFDKDVLLEITLSKPSALSLVPRETQIRHPEVVIAALENVDEDDDIDEMFANIAQELRGNREVALAFIRKEGDAMQLAYEIRDGSLSRDREVMLALIESDEAEHDRIPNSWKRNRDFMMEAVAISPRLLFSAGFRLKKDPELLLIAAESDPGILCDLERTNSGHLSVIRFARTVRGKVQLFQSALTFLCGILDKNSPVSRLECGAETTTAISRYILRCMGVPEKETLQKLLCVSTYLCNLGY